MAHDCSSFRQEIWPTLDESSRAEHLAKCEDCARWSETWSQRARALRSLEPVAAPDALTERVSAELAGPPSRLGRYLEALVRLEVPEELEPRIELEELGARSAPFLRTLDYHRVPGVLERLVAEEIADPSAARARRFVGDLEDVDTPTALQGRVRAWFIRPRVRPGQGPSLRRVVGLTAAAAAVWMLLPLFRSEPARSPRNFRVVYVESAEGLSPMARALAEGLSGTASVHPTLLKSAGDR